jgi:hypothetical protein
MVLSAKNVTEGTMPSEEGMTVEVDPIIETALGLS